MPKVQRQKSTQRKRQDSVLFAYHEAGHAVVGHVLGRCIEAVSILSDTKGGYQGYCRFSSWIESANDQNQWLNQNHHPDLITIFSAGMLAVAFFCASQNCSNDYPLRSEQDDVEKIDQLLSHISANRKQRSRVKHAQWKKAQKIVSDYWYAVDALTALLLYQGRMTGGEAHSFLRDVIGETGDDWRLRAWSIEEKSCHD